PGRGGPVTSGGPSAVYIELNYSWSPQAQAFISSASNVATIGSWHPKLRFVRYLADLLGGLSVLGSAELHGFISSEFLTEAALFGLSLVSAAPPFQLALMATALSIQSPGPSQVQSLAPDRLYVHPKKPLRRR
ncbi:hypothetical protein MUP59_06975, partial [Candidatus Bathyarchaeota archaeon]|nr:hypothetical protein [Candidatus Bathyarchaeota archaeon]